MEYHIRQYGLSQGVFEIEYIEEFFGEFPRRKKSAEVVSRLQGRTHQIVMAEAALPDDSATVVPVSFKVSHELRETETDPKLTDLVARLEGCVTFAERRVLYSWIGAEIGEGRDFSGPSLSSRSLGPSNTGLTKSSSKLRTGSTVCAARSITWSLT